MWETYITIPGKVEGDLFSDFLTLRSNTSVSFPFQARRSPTFVWQVRTNNWRVYSFGLLHEGIPWICLCTISFLSVFCLYSLNLLLISGFLRNFKVYGTKTLLLYLGNQGKSAQEKMSKEIVKGLKAQANPMWKWYLKAQVKKRWKSIKAKLKNG